MPLSYEDLNGIQLLFLEKPQHIWTIDFLNVCHVCDSCSPWSESGFFKFPLCLLRCCCTFCSKNLVKPGLSQCKRLQVLSDFLRIMARTCGWQAARVRIRPIQLNYPTSRYITINHVCIYPLKWWTIKSSAERQVMCLECELDGKEAALQAGRAGGTGNLCNPRVLPRLLKRNWRGGMRTLRRRRDMLQLSWRIMDCRSLQEIIHMS